MQVIDEGIRRFNAAGVGNGATARGNRTLRKRRTKARC